MPQERASRVEDVVVPDGEQWVRHVSGEHYKSLDAEGELCGSDHVPIVVTMRLS